MAETLKFGPEWLRALSDGTSVTSPPPSPAVGMPMYKLAEHRYGREEMLALYRSSPEVPDELKGLQSLMSEKPLQPLALIPHSEDEQRLMSNSVNSQLVLRLMGRGTGGPPIRGGGRGGPGPERGRGRGRGRGEGYYPRGPYEEDGGGFGRGRMPRDSWEEGRGGRYDRSFPPGRSFDEEAGPGPRRDFSRSMSTENWRDTKKPEEEEGGDWRQAPTRDRWAPTVHPTGSRNWREPRERYDRENFERSGRYDEYSDRPPYERGRYQRSRSSGSWEDGDPDLPEWSKVDPDDMDGLGTFDSSGAFMSMKNDLEAGDVGEELESSRSGSKEKEKDIEGVIEHKGNGEPALGKPDKPVPQKDRTSDQKESEKPKEKPKKIQEMGKPNQQTETTTKRASAEKLVIKQQDKEKVKKETKTKSVEKDSSGMTENKVKTVLKPTPLVETTNINTKSNSSLPVNSSESVEKVNLHEEENFERFEKAAENLVATLGVEEESGSRESLSAKKQSDGLDSEALPYDHEHAKKWFYRDPQGDLQGPFLSAEMAEWFSAGYFTMNLLVKRGCDKRLQPLGELIKSWGRIPFLSGASPPPLQSSQGTNVAPLSTGNMSLPVTLPATAALPVVSMGGIPVSMPLPVNPADIQSTEQLKALQQQMLMQQQFMQQQALLRQMQIQQIMQQLQISQPEFAAQPVQQQQQHALKVLLQQQALLLQQGHLPPHINISQQQAQQQQQLQQQQKLSPRSSGKSDSMQRSHSQQQLAEREVPRLSRSVSQPGGEDLPESIWGVPTSAPQATGPPAWSQPRNVWDIEPGKTQSLEEVQRMEAERIKRDAEESLRRREEEQRRFQLEEEERRRKEQEEKEREAIRLKALERQREMERRQDLERQRLELLAREQDELRRRQEEEENRRKQFEEQKRQEEIRRREEDKRRQEEEQKKIEEQQRLEELRIQELRRMEEEKLKEIEENKRQEEIKRRQEKYEELRRQQQQQQQEALRRMKSEQLSNMQLPSSAQWGSGSSPVSSAPTSTSNSALSITQIQQMEAERERLEQDERRKLEMQRQQMAAIQQHQQQLQGRSWAATAKSNIPAPTGAPSLLEIQQEQARQLEAKAKGKPLPQPKVSVPLATAAVWGSSAQSTNWAQEGAWGNQKAPAKAAPLGFWDDAITTTAPSRNTSNQDNKKGMINNNSHFPSLGSTATANGSKPSGKNKSAKANKDEETVQRIFQNMKPKDEFTQWCEKALNNMQTSVDVPTFVAFLIDVESPYEVHDYVRSYLGESHDASEFAHNFLEKRSKYRKQLRQCQQPEDDIWGPAPAINPALNRVQNNNNQNNSGASDESKSKKKKKKMQKVDTSILGFTVHAAPDRVNVGEIDAAAAAQ